ncbi:MAG: bifunctional transcriptional activator/DNA repair protein Ada [Planctomycetes bacterium]|nr:bifunctional transcriptional activator/DNA repair protein Ada [Planctomycetota bacterium]
MQSMPSPQEMERAYRRSDQSYDGVFFVAVRTTSIFCRPSCPARKPLPKNVEYFDTARAALFSGYRPCKRCRPMHTDGQPPEWAERLLAAVDREPTSRFRDADLRAMSIEPTRARRYFKQHYAMTFQAYNRARRVGEALRRIRNGADLTEVAMEHGFESDSGFRDAFARIIGRTPGRSRRADCIVSRMLKSPIGPLMACATESAVCFLEFTDRRALEAQLAIMGRRFDRPAVPGSNKHLKHLAAELTRYFAGQLSEFTVPLEYPGTPFQTAVWDQLRRIPYGRTCSYEQLARNAGRRGAQRAAGTANGKNRIAILIPCHRVVNKNGELGGYGGGLWRKRFLLDLEQGAVAVQSHGKRQLASIR